MSVANRNRPGIRVTLTHSSELHVFPGGVFGRMHSPSFSSAPCPDRARQGMGDVQVLQRMTIRPTARTPPPQQQLRRNPIARRSGDVAPTNRPMVAISRIPAGRSSGEWVAGSGASRSNREKTR